MQLSGKRALVTGSTSGIGLAIARGLANEGAKVALNGFGAADEIRGIVRELADLHGAKVQHFEADLAHADAVIDLVRRVEGEIGGVDILVNNAGIQHVAPVESFPPERWDAIIAVNLSAAFHAVRAALPGMRARGWGRIINVASVHGLVASAHKSAYVAAKHGLVGLTKVIALETAREAITCNAICPGWVDTPLVRAQVDARARESGRSPEVEAEALISEKMPSGAFVTPAQVAALALFLCGDAAAQIRGVAWPVDGAWTAQ
jgi:3-hydroxybutyrate dehydrogenase